MPAEAFEGKLPRVHADAFVHPTAVLLGDVEIGPESSVWPTAVLRGDQGLLRVGARTSIQDGSVLHATDGVSTTTVGDDVTVGHRVILHGCTVGDRCLIGMGSTVLDGAELGEGCFVGAGSLITPNKKFPPGSFILGSPARRLRDVSEGERAWIEGSALTYVALARRYRSR